MIKKAIIQYALLLAAAATAVWCVGSDLLETYNFVLP
jgi:hypothetical protein